MADRAAPAVALHQLHVAFGDVVAVESLDLEVLPGSSTALIGRNGAGKSTTLRVIAGVLPPVSGSVTVMGIDALHSPSASKQCVGYCPDVGGLIPRATPWEHLQLAASLRGMAEGWQDRATDLLRRFELLEAADRVTAGFSHGMGRRTSVVLAAFHEPAVLLLDEPFDGVDPVGVDATLDLIDERRSNGTAVIVSTHLLELAVRACERALVLSRGRVVADDAASALAGRQGADRYRALLT